MGIWEGRESKYYPRGDFDFTSVFSGFTRNHYLKIIMKKLGHQQDNDLKAYLKSKQNSNTILGQNSTFVSAKEYAAYQETSYLLSSKKNAQRLFKSIGQLEKGQVIQKPLSDFA